MKFDGQASGAGLRRRRISAANDDPDHPFKGWIMKGFAVLEFFPCEAFVIVSSCQANARLLGAERLHQHLSATRSTPGPACHLCQQLKRPFGRTKVGHVQGHVRLHYAHQRNVGEIESLGNHLRAEQDVDQPFAKALSTCS